MCSGEGNGVCPVFSSFVIGGSKLMNRNKPWSHTTTFEKPDWRQEGKGSQFGDTARGNEVMKAYD
jgi:hypothetical protein